MKSIICASLLFAVLACAGERSDRDEIQRVVEALNNCRTGEGRECLAGLFTDDADHQLALLTDLDRRMLPADTPWPEVTTPRIVVRSIRLITPDVALVDAANTQYGSVILVRRVPILIVMRREAKGWRIASLRVMLDLMSLP